MVDMGLNTKRGRERDERVGKRGWVRTKNFRFHSFRFYNNSYGQVFFCLLQDFFPFSLISSHSLSFLLILSSFLSPVSIFPPPKVWSLLSFSFLSSIRELFSTNIWIFWSVNITFGHFSPSGSRIVRTKRVGSECKRKEREKDTEWEQKEGLKWNKSRKE